MKTITLSQDRQSLEFDDTTIACSNNVRSLANGERQPDEVVYTEPDDGSAPVPYDPYQFTPGTWDVTAITDETDPDLAPEFIATSQKQMVPVLSVSGTPPAYGPPTGAIAEDAGCGIHNSVSPTTLGCVRITNSDDRATLTAWIRAQWAAGEKVQFIVPPLAG